MNGPAYPAARLVSARVLDYFARRHADARERGQDIAGALPQADVLETLIDAAFWASLRREEGYVPKISLAFLPPEEAGDPLIFDGGLPLRPAALTKVAPAVERSGIHLGVWPDRGELRVWGTTHAIPALCLVLEVAAPGLLVIKHHRGEEYGKFVNVAVLEGDQIKVVDERASNLPPDCPSLVASMLGFDSPASWTDSNNVLVQLAVSMRDHRRGGSLLIVPPGTDTWLESIVRPIPYPVSPPYADLAQLNRENPDAASRRLWQDAVDRTVAAVAGLTAVDGATVLTTDLELLAFGAKITRRKGWAQVEQVTVTEPIEGGAPVLVHPVQLGGTRHLAAVQFVHDQRDAVALVASQDGRFTIFAWSSCESRVHAHRVEALLL
jgi:hypothetical protein